MIGSATRQRAQEGLGRVGRAQRSGEEGRSSSPFVWVLMSSILRFFLAWKVSVSISNFWFSFYSTHPDTKARKSALVRTGFRGREGEGGKDVSSLTLANPVSFSPLPTQTSI